ncbi:hypothetical protein WH42_11085 [Acinetobacter baumannii]|nr:hypothetical protein WH42_11085 [Acinetobacter baumannii]
MFKVLTMSKVTKKRKCGSCGGYCGGRKGSCKFAANELKKREDQLWALAVCGYRKGASHE